MEVNDKLSKMIKNMYNYNQIEKIDFVPPVKKDTYIDDLRSKYIKSEKGQLNNEHKNEKTNQHLPILPKIMISNPDLINYSWQKHRICNVGLRNVGNTCFLNSVLQIFAHTAPFFNYIVNGTHKQECNCTM